MSKAFEIVLTVKNPYNPIKSLHHETIEGDDLVELCSKIPLAIARATKTLEEEHKRHQAPKDDDIPF